MPDSKLEGKISFFKIFSTITPVCSSLTLSPTVNYLAYDFSEKLGLGNDSFYFSDIVNNVYLGLGLFSTAVIFDSFRGSSSRFISKRNVKDPRRPYSLFRS